MSYLRFYFYNLAKDNYKEEEDFEKVTFKVGLDIKNIKYLCFLHFPYYGLDFFEWRRIYKNLKLRT